MNLVEVKNLAKTYKQVQAVRGISFAVQEGEIFGLLGPNGAGKTTTLEILEGLKEADSGQIKILPKAQLGIVLQDSGFFPGLSIRELMIFFASLYPKTQNLDELLDRFELQSLQTRQAHELSGGQRQRLALALAIIHQPKLLILDEPTVGLDPQVRQSFWDEILKLRKQGMTILLTTHYMEEAEIVCDQVAIIDHGKIVAQDRPVKLINSLGIVSRVRFMSSKPINVGTLEELSGVQSARRDRYAYDLETESPELTLRELLAFEKTFSGRIFNLQVQQATLDDVFLKLTGHHIRE